MTRLIEATRFTRATQLLRTFFLERGYKEVHTQNRLSILAACEDPATVATFNYINEVWPLPQTGQMWLEYELLMNPEAKGFFCVSTSYRKEPNPIPGRHEIIFPMFEFEGPGHLKDLIQLEKELLAYLGFGPTIQEASYQEFCKKLGASSIDTPEEEAMAVLWDGVPCIVKNFPNKTSPFWNMKQNGDGTAAKVDIVLEGQETIGSAERSCNVEEMRHMFYNISEGAYARLLFDTFGQERVERELKDFFALPFFPRFGGGIGLTRLMRALDLNTSRQQHSKACATS
jgi:aspartyl/asparaginyl-tRNA synthetase